jgi:DNA invertase Pin-like site-specific DNA recombinase
MTTTQTNRTAIAYLRVSTTDQGDSGLGLEAQLATIEAWAARSGVEIVETITEIQSGKNLRQRPQLRRALDDLAAGKASTLVASHVSRLARSVSDLSTMLDAANRKGFELVALDTGLDTSTPAGRMVIQMLAAAAEYERAMVGERTRKALAAAQARGVVLGRPTILDDVAAALIGRYRADGMTFAEIATALNSESITTPTGKTWAANNVARTLGRNGGDPAPRRRGPRVAA